MPLAADEVLLYPRRRCYIITNGREMLAPYDYMFICFGADLTSTHGTGEPVPYERPLAAVES